MSYKRKSSRSMRQGFVIVTVIVACIMLMWNSANYSYVYVSNNRHSTPFLCIFTTFRPGFHKLQVC